VRTSQQLTQLRILHGALLASLAVYAVVAVVVTRGPAPPSTVKPMDPGVFVPILGGVSAAFLLVVIPLLRRKLMPAREPFPQELEDEELDGHGMAALGKLRSASIITWALCESVAMFGLIATILYREPLYYAPFGVVSAGALLAHAPRRVIVDEVVRAARSGQGTPG
jgi:hypothetical protein